MNTRAKTYNPIRDALGEHNDPAESCDVLVKRLADSRDRLLAQVMICKPDAERYRKLQGLGNGWLAAARAKQCNGGPSIDEQLDAMTTRAHEAVDLPTGTGTGYRLPEHPSERQLIDVASRINPEWPQLPTADRQRLTGKLKTAWECIARVINDNH